MVLLRLQREIAADRAGMAVRYRDATDVMSRWVGAPPAREFLIVGAVALHAWYTGLEAILERVARALDGEVPTGDGSHRALLSQGMLELPQVRPPVIPATLQADLRSLLSFRHFFRHAYAVELDPDKLELELRRLMRVAPLVEAALDAFEAFLTAAAQSLAGESP